MTPATTQQLKAIHALLHKKGLLHEKPEIITVFTDGRTHSSKEMTMEEARELLIVFNTSSPAPSPQGEKGDKGPMIRKLFAMAHEMGWIVKTTMVTPAGEIVAKNDNSRVYGWVLKYGYLKKDLRQYQYKELPKLLTQFEFGPYKDYISNKK